MSTLSPEARRLLDQARGGYEPTGADRTRIRAKLLARAAGAVAIGTAAATASSSGAAATAGGGASLGLLAKALGVVALAGAVSAGVLVTSREAPPAAPRHEAVAPQRAPGAPVGAAVAPTGTGGERLAEEAPAPAPSASGVPAADPPAAPPAAGAAAVAPRRVPAPVPAAAPAAAGTGIEVETGLLREAQAALREGRGEEALALLDARRAGLERGVLLEERLALRILTLCNVGRVDEARAEAERFLRERPGSPIAERVRSSCGGQRAK